MYRSIVGLLLSLVLATPLAAEEGKVEEFGDWGKRCEQGQAGKEVCFLFQSATSNEDGRVVLRVRVGYKPDTEDTLLMVATVPLGAMLPAGAALVLEGEEPVKMIYLACAAEGCITTGTPLPETVIAAMKKGEKASVRIVTLNKQVVALPVSLKGFSEGLATLKP
jgi:invasion protein IalB